MDQRDKLAKNTILLSMGTLLTNVLQFVMVPLFSSWLTTAEYGTFDLCVTYVSLALPIVNLASGEAVFRYSIECMGEERKKIVSDGAAIVALNSLIISVLLLWISKTCNRPIIIPFLALLLGQTINSYCQSFLRGIKKLSLYSIGSIITTVFISVFVTIFVWKLHLGLYGIIGGYAVGYFIGDIVILWISRYWKYFSARTISKEGMIRLIKYSYPLIPNNICWWIINVSDRLIINNVLGAAYNGIYAIANKVPNVCASVFGMFNISWQESASEVANEKDRNLYFNSIYNSTIVTLLSLCTGVLSLNWILFDFIFDHRYESARLYMPILVVAIIFNSLSQFYGGIMISLKKPKANGITTMMGAIVNIAVHIGMISFVGLYAAAISTMVSNMALCLFRRINLRKVVLCKIEKRTLLYSIVLIYMLCSAYMQVPLIVRMLNVVIASVFFVYVNHRMLLSMVHKVIKR